MSEIERISVAEFRAEGYLQELNRRFLHPLGLALEIVVEEDGSEHFGGVWDYRDDPEGIIFDSVGEEQIGRTENVDRLWSEREPARVAALGYMVQPVP